MLSLREKKQSVSKIPDFSDVLIGLSFTVLSGLVWVLLAVWFAPFTEIPWTVLLRFVAAFLCVYLTMRLIGIFALIPFVFFLPLFFTQSSLFLQRLRLSEINAYADDIVFYLAICVWLPPIIGLMVSSKKLRSTS